MRLKIVLFVTLFSTLVAHTSYPQDSRLVLDLAESIKLALESNENILIAQNDIETASARVREAWADALPDIKFNGLYTRNFKQQIILPGLQTICYE